MYIGYNFTATTLIDTSCELRIMANPNYDSATGEAFAFRYTLHGASEYVMKQPLAIMECQSGVDQCETKIVELPSDVDIAPGADILIECHAKGEDTFDDPAAVVKRALSV